jgi:O-Antigen ligase
MVPAGLLAFGSVGCGGVAPLASAPGTAPSNHSPAPSAITDARFTGPDVTADFKPERGLARESWRNGLTAALPIGFVLGLLLLATAGQGAFALDRWAPPALFAVLVLAVCQLSGGGRRVRGAWPRLAIGALWGLAAWSLLSALWAGSPEAAWEMAGRTALYAAIVTAPFVLVADRLSLQLVGAALIAGLSAIALVTLVRLQVDGSALFLAGRLDSPVGYRNATGCLFAMAFWPLIVVSAARATPRPLRAGAMGLATLMLGLGFLTQSRGILPGLLCGAVVALTLGPDRVRRAWLAVLGVGLTAAAGPALLAPYHAFDAGHGTVTSGDIAHAAHALLALAIAGAVAGLAIALFDAGMRPSSIGERRVQVVARAGLVVLALAAVVAALAATGNPITYAHRKLDEFKSLQTNATASTRLTTTGGQRYDLWRVAWREFEHHPLGGVGAGSYAAGYYRHRATDRNLDTPHSLFLGALAETGIVGLGLLLAFLAGLVGTMATGWRRAPPGVRRSSTALAAAGAVLLGQSAVDWMWLIPGLTAIGILALGTAAAQLAEQDEPAPGRAWPRFAMAAALGAAFVAIVPLYLSDAYVRRARAQALASPQRQLSAARSAAQLDPLSVTPRYLEASALETLGHRAGARRQLDKALSLEPGNYATLALLGDFEARGGDLATARRYYRRALALNPLDVGLRKLTRIGLR